MIKFSLIFTCQLRRICNYSVILKRYFLFLLALRMTHDESLAKMVLMNDSSRLNNFRFYHSQKLRKKTENTDHQRTLLMTNTDRSGNYGHRESTDSRRWWTRNPRTAGFLFNFRMLVLRYGLRTVRQPDSGCPGSDSLIPVLTFQNYCSGLSKNSV